MAWSWGGFWTDNMEGTTARMNQCLVGWGTYAELPAAADYDGCIGYTTDRKVAYYSNGSAWVQLGVALNLAETIAGAKSFSGTVLIAGDLQHVGDTNTKLAFTADAIDLQAGGASQIDLTTSGLRIGGAAARVTGILDEDAMGSASAVKLCTQQSIKAYVDGKLTMLTNAVQVLASGASQSPVDVDCTAATSALAKAVVYHLYSTGGADGVSVRKNGSTDTYISHKSQGSVSIDVIGVVGVDGGEIFEYHNESASKSTTIHVIGYFE